MRMHVHIMATPLAPLFDCYPLVSPRRIVSSSYDSIGSNFLSFWDADSGALLHREATRWRLDVLLWAESAALVLVCGKGETPGSSSAISVRARLCAKPRVSLCAALCLVTVSKSECTLN